MVNILNATEMFTLKGLILCYVNYTPMKKMSLLSWSLNSNGEKRQESNN